MARFTVGLSLVLLLVTSFSFAQGDPAAGIQPFSTNNFGIDLASSNINLSIPARSKIGKLPFSSMFVGNYHVVHLANSWGVTSGLSMYISPIVNLTGTISGACPSYKEEVTISIIDGTGASHAVPGAWIGLCGGNQNNGTWVTSDGSGYTLVVTNGIPTVYDRNGVQNVMSGNLNVGYTTAWKAIDPDGAIISLNTTTGNWTDSLNTTALTQTYNGSNAFIYSYLDASGNPQGYTMTYAATKYNFATNFGCTGWAEYSASYAPVVSVTTPTGGVYSFSYETTPNKSGYYTGRIKKITYPSGGSVSYSYSGGNNGINCTSGVVPTLTVTVNDNNGNSGTWTYVNSNNSIVVGDFTVTKTDPAGNQTIYSFVGEYQTQAVYYQGTSTILKTVTTCYNGTAFASCAAPSTPTLPITQTDVYTSLGTSPTNHVQTLFDTYGNVGQVVAYDFDGTTLYRQDNYYGQSYAGNYVCNAYPSGTYIRNTPCFSFVNGASEEQVTYSNTGHATSTSRWASGSNWLTSSAAYGTNGAAPGVLSSVTDANGAVTNFGNFVCNGVLPTSTTYPLTSVGSSSETWDCNGGVITSVKDVNGNTTSYSYTANGADPLYRLKFITRPDGGSSNFSYNTRTPPWNTGVWTQTNSSTGFQHTVSYDGLGRPIANYDTDPNNTTGNPTGQRNTGITYNNLGRVAAVTNPFFSTSDPTYGSTAYSYDALGRTTLVTLPSMLKTQYTYTNRATKVVQFPSQNAFTKIYQSDGLGRLVDICEVTSVTQANGTAPYSCGLDISATGFLSTLTYDALNNVLTMNRDVSAQQRSMKYDGLSRLLSVTTPEAGTTTYVYDTATAGDLYTETRPMPNVASGTPEVVTYGFDPMHRLTSKSYSDGKTPGLALYYDRSSGPANWPNNKGSGTVSLPNGRGRLAMMNNEYPSDAMFGYDSMGRVSVYAQCSPTGCANGLGFVTNYSYDYLGDVLGGNNILNNFGWTNTYNQIGQLTQVTTSSGNLVSGITYNALGQPVSDMLGNGQQESWKYSVDGVPTNYSVGSSPVFDWNLTVNTGVISASNDNQYAGNVYTYDDFGRLATMKGANGAGGGCSYGYDQYGNRWNQTVIQGSCPSPSYSFSNQTTPNTNHIIGGVTYDDAGNMTYDGSYYYTYDGNNKVIAVGTTSGGNNVASYAYNTRGMRVSTTTTGPVEWMFDLAGNALTASVPGTTQFYEAEYYVGGRDWGTVATGGINFRYPDWVGNGRVWQDSAGTVTQQAAYGAFGDGLFAPGGGTCCPLQEGMYDSAWQDSGNNTYHTLNREYSPTQGRWLTPDPAGLAAADPANPQTWNRYAYALNNPVTFTDPTGLDVLTGEPDWTAYNYFSGASCDPTADGTCIFQPRLPFFTSSPGQSGFSFGFGSSFDNSSLLCGESVGLPCGLPIDTSIWNILGIHPPCQSDFGAPCDGGIPGAMGAVNTNDYCGIGYHCDSGDIAESCAADAGLAAIGITDLDFYTLDQIWNKLRQVGTGPGARAAVGSTLGRTGRGLTYNVAGKILTLSAVYSAGKNFYQTFSNCWSKNAPIPY